MRKVHEKSIILGIGIGMIITAIAGMIFSAGTQKELSKEDIMGKAKLYGMVEKASILNNENTSKESTSATKDSSIDDNTTTDSPSTDSSKTIANRNIFIEIKYGYKAQDVAEVLYEKAVIQNKDEFITVLKSYNAFTNINTGTFEFKKNEDLHYIVKTICNIQ